MLCLAIGAAHYRFYADEQQQMVTKRVHYYAQTSVVTV